MAESPRFTNPKVKSKYSFEAISPVNIIDSQTEDQIHQDDRHVNDEDDKNDLRQPKRFRVGKVVGEIVLPHEHGQNLKKRMDYHSVRQFVGQVVEQKLICFSFLGPKPIFGLLCYVRVCMLGFHDMNKTSFYLFLLRKILLSKNRAVGYAPKFCQRFRAKPSFTFSLLKF